MAKLVVIYKVYGGFCDDCSLITHGNSISVTTMVCTICGHPNDSHQYVTSSLYYCGHCKVLESHIAFTQDEGAENPSKSNDVMTELYNAFRK